jgi:putative membrane protein
MVAVALWIGAVMAAYLFNLNLVPASLAHEPRLALAVGKFVVPASVTVLQTALAYLMLVFGLGVQAPSSVNLLLTMVVASWVFLAMLFALLRVFGEASKLLAVLLLTLQLAAGGGVIPVELSGGLFQTVHHWLPFTWVVKAFRVSLFGAYDHGWGTGLGHGDPGRLRRPAAGRLRGTLEGRAGRRLPPRHRESDYREFRRAAAAGGAPEGPPSPAH